MFGKYWKSKSKSRSRTRSLSDLNDDDIVDDQLTPYEKNEIKSFDKDKIFYTSALQYKLITGNNNNGYDDSHEYYMIRKYDHIYYRYKIINKLGNGQYGNAIHATDMKYNTPCAIKIIKNNQRYLFMCRQEIDFLIKLLNNLELGPNEKEKIILIKKEFYFRNHLCIVSKLYYLNLYQYQTKFGNLPLKNSKSVVKDLFLGLKYLKKNNIIHGDLKPENIFFYDNMCENVVIGDFGLSLYNTHIKSNTNIQTMWYRSPEVVFCIPFDFSVDLWSLGAIIYEIITSKELFRAKIESHLLIVFHEVLGIPSLEFIESHPKISRFYDNSGYPKNIYINGKIRTPSDKPIPTDMPLYDIIIGCLQWDRHKRIDYDKAIELIDMDDNTPDFY